MKKILVLGLGKFGSRFCQVLAERRDVRVFAFDLQDKTIERIATVVHTAGSGDLDDSEALGAFLEQIGQLDAAVISVGDNVNTSILAALRLREAGVPRIVIKATDTNHRRVLEAIDHGFPGERRFEVLIPELDAADRLGRSLASDFVASELPLGSGLGVMEFACPVELSNVALKELDLRRRFHITVIGYRASAEPAGESGEMTLGTPDTVLPEGCLVTVIGKHADLQALEKKFGGR